MSDASTRTFDGYRRADGRAGVRNHVLVLSPTGLTSAAAARIGALVRGTVCVTSGYGRGQVAADAQLQFDTLMRSRRAASRSPVSRCRTCARTRWRWSMPACVPQRAWCVRRRCCGGSHANCANSAWPSNAAIRTRRRGSSPIRSPDTSPNRSSPPAVRRCSAKPSNGPVPSIFSHAAPSMPVSRTRSCVRSPRASAGCARPAAIRARRIPVRRTAQAASRRSRRKRWARSPREAANASTACCSRRSGRQAGDCS